MEKRRFYNFFKQDGRSLILAFDHGEFEPLRFDVGDMLQKAVRGGIDGILTSYGVAKQYRDLLGNIGLMIRADNNSTGLNHGGDSWRPIYSAQDVVAIGGDGMMVDALPGAENVEDDFRTMQTLSRIVADCDRYGLVSAGEVLAMGLDKGELRTVDNVALACRAACERGVDFIKTTEAGDFQTYGEVVVKNSYRPLLLHGGSKVTDEVCLKNVREALDVGVKGFVMGRNIFANNNVERFCFALAKLVHEDCSLEAALKVLKE